MKLLAIDGIDATGKSSVVAALAAAEGVPALGEFSATPIGDLIRSIVARNDFFYLDSTGKPRVAETFVLASDLLAKLESARWIDAPFVVMERGALSLRAYQHARIARDIDLDSADEIDTLLRSLFHLSKVDCIDVLLTVNETVMLRRKAARGDPAPSQDEIDILMTAQSFMVSLVEAGGGTIADTS
ncbi:MAG: hypothetical protein AAB490_05265, partial [Patescibacteria group bacterium]